jgi:hypothetical protein
MVGTLADVQDIGVGAARVVAVTASENTDRIFLELRGIRDAGHSSDRDTRLRVAMSTEQAAVLRRRLSEVLPPSQGLEWRNEILELLDVHHAESGAAEDALETLQRLSSFWREHHPKPASDRTSR